MSQQTSYNDNPPPALAGLVRWTEGTRVWTKVASGSVPIGMLVKNGTQSLSAPYPVNELADGGSAGTIVAYTSAAISDDPLLDSEYVGVPILDLNRMAQSAGITTATQGSLTYSVYGDKQAVPVLRKGELWVLSENAVTQFADVYVRMTVATNNPVGQFSMSTGTGKVKFTHGRWLMTTSGAGLALMELF
jgi:hypothetical protein